MYLIESSTFDATVFKNILDKISDKSKVIITNIMDYEEVNVDLFKHIQSNYQKVSIASYHINETFIKDKKDIIINGGKRYFFSGYFQDVDTELNKKYLKDLNSPSNTYIDDTIYQITVYIEFIKDLPDEIPSRHPNIVRNEISINSVNLIGSKVSLSYSFFFDRTMFVYEIDDSGNLKSIKDLYSELPSFYALNYVENICSFDSNISFISFGFMGDLNNKDDKLIWSYFHGIYDALTNLNTVKIQGSYLSLLLPPSKEMSLDEQYKYFIEKNVIGIFIFTYNNMKDILPYVDNDEENDESPFLLVTGYYSGEICNPKILFFGISVNSLYDLYNVMNFGDSVYIISTNDEFGKVSYKILNENYENTFLPVIKAVFINKTEDITKEVNAMNSIIDSDTNVYVIFNKCKYNQQFMKDYKSTGLSNKVNIFTLDPYCFDDFDNVYIIIIYLLLFIYIFIVGWILYNRTNTKPNIHHLFHLFK